MAKIVYTGKPIQASTINDYYNRLDAIRTWNGRYSAISNRGSVLYSYHGRLRRADLRCT